MAKNALNVNFYPNTLKDNDAILRKLRSRSKIDNKTQEEWSKLFTKLNTESKKQTNKTSDGNSEDVTYGVIEGFPSGSWWGIRMDCARDRVHKSFDNDIDEGVFGVASICTSHVNTTNDVDLGTYLTFTGGKYNQSKPTDPLLTNFNNHIPLRLIRSYNLANEFAPKTGYRYDGLYIVASCWIGINSKDSTRYYKYALARLNHQEAPPWVTQTRIVTRQSSSQKSPLKSCGLYKCHMYGCSQESKKFKSCESEVEKVKLNADLGEKEKEASLLNSLNFISKPYKLQNTNISIRTELYDSSPNPQQDIKKTPMTYCRVYNKTKSESKKLDVELKKVQQEDKITECKNLFLDSRASTRASVGSESSGLSEKKVDLQKAVVEIETMTPEQMLNLIIKKRYNPTGKLLIGSIIGLPENEGKNLNAGKVKDREGKSKMNHFRETRSTVKNQEVKVNRSKSKKSVPRKRKNELANLTIDANFGMNLRGQCIQTRTMKNRRLRCPAIILSKRKDLSDYITSYPRVELRRKGKIIATAKKSQINGCKRLSVGNKNKDEGKHEIRGNLKDRNNCNNILKRRNKIINTESSLIKPRMVDASTQCIATKDATTFVNMETQKKNEKSLIKIEVIDLEDEEEMEEVKSEFEDSNSEEEEEEEESLRQKKFYSGNDVNINNDNDDNDNLSAFVALSDRDMRVARLRSIGFKPIEPVIVSENGSFVQYYNCDASTSSLHAVTERQVDEQYNKYTSEENNVVEYMDHELHFQDIEEDGIKHDYKISGGNFDVNKGDYKSGKKRRCSSSEEEFQDDESKNFDEQEAPWLGWSRSTANR
ncbi:putative leucine-rich repeat-containing protein DDB_G0290503 isoform X2 [Cotesia glomerata]|uniref:putative leucine-rich repeat-containing protein DDB_G0290503 isoform X2 n=1 Tax=Cotesia glomerata TaxID=32391 RepID=UPI001D018227|nr:putative leucine-rich repeat-containing protein DDB_G0290503 isoform X2 [Cotesia glomerata]